MAIFVNGRKCEKAFLPSPFIMGGLRVGSRIIYEVDYRIIIEYNIIAFIISSIMVYLFRDKISEIINNLKD